MDYDCKGSVAKIFVVVSLKGLGAKESGLTANRQSFSKSGSVTSDKGMVRSDISKPALIFFSLQEYTKQNLLSKF
jgi:hypothetical protein